MAETFRLLSLTGRAAQATTPILLTHFSIGQLKSKIGADQIYTFRVPLDQYRYPSDAIIQISQAVGR